MPSLPAYSQKPSWKKAILKAACGGKNSFPGTHIMKPSKTLYLWAIRCAWVKAQASWFYL
ncbi:hypothetical protein B1A57_09205 [Corynebacterium diphtheriae]|nr:hypothetical protein B1A57_09205 [Corynebacterium diphtheriae]